ncbi:MAG: choice-of-anchor D domain-containing protein, partial [Candidatus Kapaibacteriota bacterium]
TDELGMTPDDLEFAEVKSGQFVWKKVNVKFPGVDPLYGYNVNGKRYAYKVIQLPQSGVFKLRAKKPFAAYSYGFSDYDSYGYPTSAALADLEKPDTLPPVPKWRDSCGVISFATVTDMPDDPTIRSNMAMIVLHPYPESFNVDFKYTDFIPGETRTVPWRLEVVDKTQDARAVITFSDRRGNDTTIVIEYKAVKLTIRPNFTDWGLLKQNSGQVSKEFWVINENEQSAALVTSLVLKSGNQHFTIDMLGRSLPFWLAPKDSVKILVWFDPVENGTFADSIGVGDTCVFAYKTRVQASVGQPMIEVSDINFGSVTVGNTVAREFAIRNPGTTDLHIWGYTGPTNGIVYKATTLPPVDINNRLAEEIVVKPGQEIRYTVEFTPDAERDYPDKIIFFSDASERDSICDLYGIGIKPGLESNSYNWGRKRIDRASHPAGPYAVPTGDVIKLRNTGTQEVHISGLIEVENINGEAFEFDRGIFNNLTLQPGEERVVSVVFHPTKVGEHRLRLRFQNTANSQTETILEGIGIVGQLETVDLTFDPMVIFDEANKQTKTMYIENKSYQWEDSVEITDLVVNPAGAIAEDGTSYGTEGFGYDKAALDLPVVLQPGQRLYIDGYFVAQKVQPTSATLTTVSDAISEVTSTWSGSGISRGIRSTGGSAKICVGDRTEITCVIENPAQGELSVTKLSLNGDFEGIAFLNPADAFGFKIAPGGRREVKLVYQPTKVEQKRVWLMIENNTLDKNPDSCAIDVEAVQYKGTARINVVAENVGRVWPVAGDKIPISIEFTTSDNLILAQVKELEVTIKYKPGLLKVDAGSIEVGNAISGRFNMQNVNIDDAKGEMNLRLVATGTNILNESGQILRFKFDSFLPTEEVGTDYSTLVVDVEARGTQCLLVDDVGSEVKLQPTCVYDLRWIATTANQYYLGQVTPNPVKGGTLDVNFGVAFDGWTEIVIINTKGEIVKRVTTGAMRAGDYNVRVDVGDLPNGMYIITMSSEHFRQKQEFILMK